MGNQPSLTSNDKQKFVKCNIITNEQDIVSIEHITDIYVSIKKDKQE